MGTMKNKTTKTISVATLISILAGILVFAYLAVRNKDEFRRDIQVKNVSICYKVNADNYYKSDNCKDIFTEHEVNDLYVCGYIDAPYSEIKNLSLVITSNQSTEPFFANPPNDKFGVGYFCRKITLPPNGRVDAYQIDFYYFREIVASIRFDIH